MTLDDNHYISIQILRYLFVIYKLSILHIIYLLVCHFVKFRRTTQKKNLKECDLLIYCLFAQFLFGIPHTLKYDHLVSYFKMILVACFFNSLTIESLNESKKDHTFCNNFLHK